MRKIVVILIVIMLFSIVGCSNKKIYTYDYNYRGENEFWAGEYKVSGNAIFTEKDNKTSYEGNGSEIFTVTYKGDISELASVRHLEIYSEDTKLVYDLDSDESLRQKTFILKSRSTDGVEPKKETVEVNINIDGKIQTIELKNVK